MSLVLESSQERCEPSLGLRERQRQARNESILQAAFDLIAEKGYAALTMDDIAERVGISRQTLYLRFASKEAIALAALVKLADQMTKSISELDSNLAPLRRLESVVRWMVSLRFSATPAALIKDRSILGPIKAHPDYAKAAERRTEAIIQIVAAAQSAGEISSKMSPELIVQMLLGIAFNATYEGLVADHVASPQEIEDQVSGAFLRGIGAQI